MNLPALLVQLRGLVQAPDTRPAQLVRLLSAGEGLAEFEVARHYVAAHFGDRLRAWACDPDPRVRARAMELVRFGLPVAESPAVLRRRAQDPAPMVRARVASLVRRMSLSEVALPARPRRASRRVQAPAAPVWGVEGWRYGLDRARREAPKKPPKGAVPAAVRAALKSMEALCAALGLDDPAALQRWRRPGTGPGAPYLRFTVPKRTGGTRAITAPIAALKRVQRAIYTKLLAPLAPHPAAHGFVPGRSVATNAAVHVGAARLLKVDLADFFPTVHYRRVEGFFVSLGAAPAVAQTLAGLTTFRPRMADGYVVTPGEMPQGAPTSPALANLVCRRLDARLTGLAARLGARYTRYADDLTFSWPPGAPLPAMGRTTWWIDQICQQEGFAVNPHKTRVVRRSGRMMVTGVVVNDTASVPRATRRRLRAMLHDAGRVGVAGAARGRPDFVAQLLGQASWVHAVQPRLGARMLAAARAVRGATEAPPEASPAASEEAE